MKRQNKNDQVRNNYKKQLCKVVVTEGNIEDQFCIDIKCERGVTFQHMIDYMTSAMVQTAKGIVDSDKSINLYALKDNMMSVLNGRLDNLIGEYLGDVNNE